MLKRDYQDQKLLNRIKSDYNLAIHDDRQGKHIKGHKNYNGKSYLLDEIDPQELVNKYAGTGEIRRTASGKWIGKQFFVNDTPIGYVVDPDTGAETLTHRFSIEYSKEKGTHIVPRYEDGNSK